MVAEQSGGLVEACMQIVGVIDIREGQAVHARAGRRDAYQPVARVAGVRVDGDAVALARTYVEIGVRELYLADLDAITGGLTRLNTVVIESVAALGVPVWVDAGVASSAEAVRVENAGAAATIVGLETLSDFERLSEIVSTIGEDRVTFSVDLRDGQPIVMPNAPHASWSPSDIARHVSAAGVARMIVLDLARVGTGAGIDRELMTTIRQAAPAAALFVGGGVRDESDLEAVASAGFDGALVATALITGAIRPRL